MRPPFLAARAGQRRPARHWHRWRPRRLLAYRPLIEGLEERTLLAASIGGTVWNDLNSNGVHEVSEPGLAGTTVFLDDNRNGVLDGSQITLAPNSFKINPTSPLTDGGIASDPLVVSGLAPRISDVNVHLTLSKPTAGAMMVGLVSPLGTQLRNGPILFIINGGDQFEGTLDDQATRQVTLAASPFLGAFQPQNRFTNPASYLYDGDPNGEWRLVFYGTNPTPADLVLESWSLTFTVPEPTTQTDAEGGYTFSNLAAGNYAVGVAPTPAAQVTFPIAGLTRTATVGADQATGGIDFGIHAAPDLVGVSFHVSGTATDWGSELTVAYTVQNRGAGEASPFVLELRLSPDGDLTAGDPLLQSIVVPEGLPAFGTTSGTLTVQLPGTSGNPPPGFGWIDQAFLGFLIDAASAIAESDEANNANQGAGLDLAAVARTPNTAVTASSRAQQQPSVAVDPLDPQHVVIAYMDYSLSASAGFAGIVVAVSRDGGATWQRTPITIPAAFNEAAGYPVARFDAQGRVHVSFMAATFKDPEKPPLIFPAGNIPSTSIAFRSLGMKANNGIFVARSDDGGTTWNTPVAVASNLFTVGGPQVFFETIPDSAVDTFEHLPDGSPNPNFGNLYVTWTRYYPDKLFPGVPLSSAKGGSDLMLAVSSDAGQTWTIRTQQQHGVTVSVLRDPDFVLNNAANPPGGGSVNFSHVTVGPEGDLYISAFAGGPFRVYHSTDAGASFRMPNAFQQIGFPFGPTQTFSFPNGSTINFPSLQANNSFRIFPVREIVADPTQPGVVYAVEAIQVRNPVLVPPGANALIDAGEVNFARSTDYGRTWQRIFTVGSNPSNLTEVPLPSRIEYRSTLNDDDGGRHLARVSTSLAAEVITNQLMPRLSLDEEGNLTIIWYDTRRDPANHLLDVFGTVSRDGGQSFSANFRVTDVSFDADLGRFTNPRGGNEFFLGDFIGLATHSGTAFASWTDTRNGTAAAPNQDIFFTRFPLPPAPARLGDRFEPNDASTQTTNLGIVTGTRLFPRIEAAPGNEDWYRLQTGATGDLVVRVLAETGAELLDLELWDKDGQVRLAAATEIRDASGRLTGREIVFPTPSGQTFLLRVRGAPTGTINGVTYSLSVHSLTADLGTAVNAALAASLDPGQRLVYEFQAAVSGTLDVKLTSGANVQGNLNLQLLSADGLTVLRNGTPTGNPGPGEVERVSNLAVEAGRILLIRVIGATATSRGAFTLDVTNLDQFQTGQKNSLFFPARGNPNDLVTGDVNGDGFLDVVATTPDYTNPINVLLGNGDGTFDAARGFDAGPGSNGLLGGGFRGVLLDDFDGDGLPDVAVTNFRSADVSVLVGRGDGSFSPARRSDAVVQPHALASGDFNGDGLRDLAVLQRNSETNDVSRLAVLLGHGDGTFRPPVILETTFPRGAFPVLVGDFNNDDRDDIVAFSFNSPEINLFLGNEGGSFDLVPDLVGGENTNAAQVADLDADGFLDLVTAGTNTGNVYLLRGNGDGTFQPAKPFVARTDTAGTAISITGLVIGDFGRSTGFGTPDGLLDLLVTAVPRLGTGATQVNFLFGLVDQGQFKFGAPRFLVTDAFVGPMAVADLNGDTKPDLATLVPGGLRALFSTAPNLPLNDTLANARVLGTVVHVVSPTLAISPVQSEAFFKLLVPVEAVPGAGDQVMDFSALFEHTTGAGLNMEVRDAAGNLLATGERFRVAAPQGSELTLRVFGVTGQDGSRGTGTYTLVINLLPQVVSVEAPSPLPGGGSNSLVITLQGDRLEPAAAEDPANYRIIWIGPDGLPATPDDVEFLPTSSAGGQAVVYNPGANVEVSSGRTFPTSVRQTITLLFDEPLPVGSYRIELSSVLVTADYRAGEEGLLAGLAAFGDHTIVQEQFDGRITSGSLFLAVGLVQPAGVAGSLDEFADGTSFLTQLQNDLGALLDTLLTQLGDDPSVTAAILDQILARFEPAVGTAGQRPTSFLILFLDPVSLDLADPQNKRVVFDLQKNSLTQTLAKAFVEVGGNVEIVVLADVAGTFRLNVADVQPTARGGAVLLGAVSTQVVSLTDALRSGLRSFTFDIAARETPGGPVGNPGNPAPASPLAFNFGQAVVALLAGTTTLSLPAASVPGNSASTGTGAANGLGANGRVAAAASDSGGGGETNAVLGPARSDGADPVREWIDRLAADFGAQGMTLAQTGIEIMGQVNGLLSSALGELNGMGVPMSRSLLENVGGDLLQAVMPAMKALNASISQMPIPRPADAPASGPMRRSQDAPPSSAPPEIVEETLLDEPSADPVLLDPFDEASALLAAALVGTGALRPWQTAREPERECKQRPGEWRA